MSMIIGINITREESGRLSCTIADDLGGASCLEATGDDVRNLVNLVLEETLLHMGLDPEPDPDPDAAEEFHADLTGAA